jgi:hypothetical protein
MTNQPEEGQAISKADDGTKSPKTFQFTTQMAQMSYFFVTYSLTFTGWMIKPLVGMWIATFCVIYAAVHEFWYDPRYKSEEYKGSDARKFFVLLFGTIFGLGAGFLLTRHR